MLLSITNSPSKLKANFTKVQNDFFFIFFNYLRFSHFNLRILEFLNHLMSSLKMANELLFPIYNAKNKKKELSIKWENKGFVSILLWSKTELRKSLFFIFFKIIQLSDMKRKHTQKNWWWGWKQIESSLFCLIQQSPTAFQVKFHPIDQIQSSLRQIKYCNSHHQHHQHYYLIKINKK